jgi:hypothetical protein
LYLTLFRFLTQLLTSKHLNLFSSYLVGRNGTMWITCFSVPQNAKNENQLKHKNQVRNRLFIDRSWCMKVYTCHYVVSTYKTNVYINFNNNNENLKIFCLHLTGFLNTRMPFPICMFVLMASGKCAHIHFTFLQEF